MSVLDMDENQQIGKIHVVRDGKINPLGVTVIETKKQGRNYGAKLNARKGWALICEQGLGLHLGIRFGFQVQCQGCIFRNKDMW